LKDRDRVAGGGSAKQAAGQDLVDADGTGKGDRPLRPPGDGGDKPVDVQRKILAGADHALFNSVRCVSFGRGGGSGLWGCVG
jgi:hypothetical protein